jgi:hypothetical protein
MTIIFSVLSRRPKFSEADAHLALSAPVINSHAEMRPQGRLYRQAASWSLRFTNESIALTAPANPGKTADVRATVAADRRPP